MLISQRFRYTAAAGHWRHVTIWTLFQSDEKVAFAVCTTVQLHWGRVVWAWDGKTDVSVQCQVDIFGNIVPSELQIHWDVKLEIVSMNGADGLCTAVWLFRWCDHILWCQEKLDSWHLCSYLRGVWFFRWVKLVLLSMSGRFRPPPDIAVQCNQVPCLGLSARTSWWGGVLWKELFTLLLR